MSNILYRLENVHKYFDLPSGVVKVIVDLNLSIEKGQWAALVGPSGCGKTTLLQLLGGLDRPTSGKIFLEDNLLSAMSSGKLTALRRRRIGFVFQSYHLFPELSALENAALPALHWRQNRDEAYSQAKEWLCRFGLQNRLDHRPRELSGGEQQRVAIARSLINNPDIILADEPTGNLDPVASGEIIDILCGIQRSQNKSLIMVTHDQSIAKRADSIIKLTPNK